MWKRTKKILKRIMIFFSILIGSAFLIGVVFINTSPQFGGKQSDQDKLRFEKSDNYEGGKFVNLIETKMDMGFGGFVKTMITFVKGTPNREPSFELPVEQVKDSFFAQSDTTKISWFGHSAFLLRMDGLNVLIDPMLGKVPAPHPWLGGNRYYDELPLEIEEMPAIDVIIISHDHYDHLDYESITKLKDKTKQFYVPLGVGAHLKQWGVDSIAIQEFDWWDEAEFASLKFAFTPSRHFSGRGFGDRSKTLWGSWVIQGGSDNIFFSGDGGYGDHFTEIGNKYGPFEFAMMECGQYNKRWSQIHMMPEETAQAAVDVRASRMMPIHWGAFSLAMHEWSDPVVRVRKKAIELNMPLITPKIGQAFTLDMAVDPSSTWWLNN